MNAHSLLGPSTMNEQARNPSSRASSLFHRETLASISLQKISLFATTMSVSELACTYASLILHDDGISISAEKILNLVNAANVNVEAYWPGLFAKLLQKRSVEDLIMNVGSGGGVAPVAIASSSGGGAAAPPAALAAEEKKEEPKEESDDDMGFSLFD